MLPRAIHPGLFGPLGGLAAFGLPLPGPQNFAGGRQLLAFLQFIIFFNLTGMRKQAVVTVCPGGIVTIARLIFAAYRGPRLIDSAPVIDSQILALCVELNVPIAIFNENDDALMHEVPADVIEVAGRLGLIQRNRHITAAGCGAMFAKYRTQIETPVALGWLRLPAACVQRL